MAILAECPICHKKQATKNRLCTCGMDLVKAKRSKKVKYWISYYLPNGKQRREICDHENPYSIKVANAAHGKRVSQKYENPSILEKLPQANITFRKLTEWYLKQFEIRAKAEGLRDAKRPAGCLANFNKLYGERMVGGMTLEDLQNYQRLRIEEGRKPSTIDKEINYVKAMIDDAFENRKLNGETLRAFKSKKLKKLQQKGGNARDRTLTFEEYVRLVEAAPPHLKNMIVVGFYTGMRTGELHQLQWSHIDQEKGFIRLPAEITKEKKGKNIPLNDHVKKVLSGLPYALHHDFVFTYKGNPIKGAGGHKRSFETACEKADVPFGTKTPNGVTFRDIRTTVKTNMLNAGVDKVYRDIILGHSLKGMDEYYMKPSEEDLRRAMDKYTQWINDQIANNDQSNDQKGRATNF